MTKLRKDLITSALAIVAFTVLLGLLYPLVITGISQVAFPNKSNGSQITQHGKVIGSKLIGQSFTLPVLGKNGKPQTDAKGNPVTRPDPRFFQPRPSASSYNPAGTVFSNRGPNQASARNFYEQQLSGYLALEHPYDPGLTAAQVPVDAVTTSGSGVDPEISLANARIQAYRIAAVRHLPLVRVNRLIAAAEDGRFLGVLGEPGVNVLALNLALAKAVA